MFNVSVRANLRADPYHARRDTGSGITGLLRILVSAASAIVFAGVDDDGPTDDRMRSEQLHVGFRHFDRRRTRFVHDEISQVSHHALLIGRITVSLVCVFFFFACDEC